MSVEPRKLLSVSDIVHLNSGSPDLKIIAIENGKISVEWHTESGLEQAVFPMACVHKEMRAKR